MFGHILVPVDFSEPSRMALRLAVKFARTNQGRLTLLHIGPQAGFYAGEGGIPMAMAAPYEALAAEHRHAAERLAREEIPDDVAWRVEVRDGFPPEAIVKEATDGGYNLVVMGTHGRTGVGRVLLGSVTERVLHHAPCPVLVTR